MRRSVSAILLGALVLVSVDASAAAIRGRREMRVSVNWAGTKLTSALADLASQGGIGFVIDPAIPDSARKATVTFSSRSAPVQVALGQILKAAGLRYTILDGVFWISTPERVAKRIVHQGAVHIPEGEPMSRGEALGLLSPNKDEDVPSIGDLSKPNIPWKPVPKPKKNPQTGLTDFPAPPVWIDSDDRDAKRFKYTHKPSFLKPEYKNEKSDKATGGFNALAFVLSMVEKNPQWSRTEIIVLMQKMLAATDE